VKSEKLCWTRLVQLKVPDHPIMFDRHDLAEMELTELEQALESMGHARFHGRQIFQWLHKRGITDFGQMSDLPRDLRTQLASDFLVRTPVVDRIERSIDGPTKFLLRLPDGKHIESVYIPDTPAQTFCLSTQVGCAMKCGFCLTGKMGIIRNLTAGEIVGQHPQRLHRRFVIVERFAHTHEDDVELSIAQVQGAGEHAYLTGDLASAQVSNEPHFAREAERARHRAADLRREAERHRRRIGNENRFDLPFVGELKQKLLGPVR